jgi:predicted 3-demethylubiquinone-9 3-methyltransferase (glyoxalase superfamily)
VLDAGCGTGYLSKKLRDPNAQQCGWLKDRFGLSWQVVPRGLAEMLKDPGSPERRGR